MLVAVIATAVQYAVLIAAVSAGWQPGSARAWDLLLGAVVNYLLNRRFTFRSDMPHGTARLAFHVVMGVALALNMLLMQLFTQFAAALSARAGADDRHYAVLEFHRKLALVFRASG